MLSNPRPRILCVDDDDECRVMLSTLLGLALIDAKTVGTGAQALSAIEREHFDLYLLDVRLPDLDGFELCRRMRDFDPNTPILFFSGAGFEADKKRGIEAGASAYVIKPDLEAMLGSLRQLMSQPKRMAKVIPFPRENNSYAPFNLDPVAA